MRAQNRMRIFLFMASILVGVAAGCGSDEGADPAPTPDVVDGDVAPDGDAVDGDASDDSSDLDVDTQPDDATDVRDTNEDSDDATTHVDLDGTDATPEGDAGEPDPTDLWPPVDCDPIDPSLCALPWPSNLYLAPSTSSEGVHVRFGATTLPANRLGRHVVPEPYRRLDGYGLGVPIMTIFPNVDATQFAGEESLEASLDESSPSLLFRVSDDGLVRVPHFVELDENEDDPSMQVLFLRPAVILDPSSRYIVAFREVLDVDGAPVPSSTAFASLRDGAVGDEVGVESRRERFEEVFGLLESEDVARESLTLAWDFVTASEESLHGDLDTATALAISEIGEEGAELTFDDVRIQVPFADDSELPVDPYVAIRIHATMRTPNVLRARAGAGGFELNRGDDGAVLLAEEVDVPVRIQVPHRALDGDPVGVIVYGHGLLGDQNEIALGHLRRIGDELGYIVVAVPLRGMSSDDGLAVVGTTTDMSNFVAVADPLHQGIVQTHVLARTAVTRLPGMLAALDDAIVVDTSRVYWFGGSQGGIFGTSIVATSPDIYRGVLAVPGNNYATLLQRSINFDSYFASLSRSYDRAADVAVLIALAQLGWDRTDPVSYWRRLVQDPGPDGRARSALLLVAKADKQVAVLTNEILARTYDEVALMAPYDDERQPWGIPLTSYPHEGTGVILFDWGNPWPTGRANQPPNDPDRDPHPRLAELDELGGLIASFLDAGTLIDICDGEPCVYD